MNDVAQITHVHDPVTGLTAQWTANVRHAKAALQDLETFLRRMDEAADTLRDEHGIDMRADLGPIGEAAAATRRDLARNDNRPTFVMPRPT